MIKIEQLQKILGKDHILIFMALGSLYFVFDNAGFFIFYIFGIVAGMLGTIRYMRKNQSLEQINND